MDRGEPNYFNVLNLDMNASPEEIRKALTEHQRRWLARANAPELSHRQEAERMIQLLEEAEGILLDENKRQEYMVKIQQQAVLGVSADTQGQQLDGKTLARLIEEARVLINQERYADAIVAAKQAVTADPGHPEAWSVLAKAHYQWNNHAEAIDAYRMAIDIAPNVDTYYYDLAQLYIDKRNLKLALECAQKALYLKPNDPNYIFFRSEERRGGKQCRYGGWPYH